MFNLCVFFGYFSSSKYHGNIDALTYCSTTIASWIVSLDEIFLALVVSSVTPIFGFFIAFSPLAFLPLVTQA